MNRKHSIFANAAKTMAMIWRVGILGIAMCAVPLVGCSELETLLNGEEDEEEEVIENPFKEYDDSPEAMILKWKTQPAEGLYGSGEMDDPYLIRNASEFRYFINAVSDGSLETTNKNFRLMNDITVDDQYQWYPIGGPQTFKVSVHPNDCHTFYGRFDGNGYSIKGELNLQALWVEGDRLTGHFGLFYQIGGANPDYTIKDLTIDADVNIVGGSVSNSETLSRAATKAMIGVLASRTSGYPIFRNCHIFSKVKMKFDWRVNAMMLGGFFSVTGWSEFHDCSFNGRLGLDGRVAASGIKIGGIVAEVYERIVFENCVNNADINADDATCESIWIGGICGDYGGQRFGGENLTFLNCKNTGNISSNKLTMQLPGVGYLVGGIVGHMNSSFSYTEGGRIFSDCENTGDITFGEILRGDNTPDEESAPYFCMGGIVGQNLNGVSMERCVNTGNITAGSTDFGPYLESNTGGIGGYITTEGLTQCSSTGDIKGMQFDESVMYDDYYYDGGTANGTASYVGGLVGSYGSSLICSCYTSGDIQSSPYADLQYVGALLGYGGLYANVEPFIGSCSTSDASIDGKPLSYIESATGSAIGSYIGNSKFVPEEDYYFECNKH